MLTDRNPATDHLERTLAAALNPDHPRHHAAELLVRMSDYKTLPGMPQLIALLNRHDDGDVDALRKATVLAGYIVQAQSIVEDGLAAARVA